MIQRRAGRPRKAGPRGSNGRLKGSPDPTSAMRGLVLDMRHHEPILTYHRWAKMGMLSPAEFRLIVCWTLTKERFGAIKLNRHLSSFLAESNIKVDFGAEAGRYDARYMAYIKLGMPTLRLLDQITAEPQQDRLPVLRQVLKDVQRVWTSDQLHI